MTRFVSIALLALLAAKGVFAELVGHTELDDITQEDWYKAFETPNATDEISFPGIDVSEPYPGKPSDDWSFIIKVRDNVPRRSFFTAATWIQMQVPPNLLNKTVVDNATSEDDFRSETSFMNVDPSWSLCMQTSFVYGLKLKKKPKNPGRCDGILSDECLEEIHARFQNYRLDGEKPECPSLLVPDVCRKQFKDLKGYDGHGMDGVKIPGKFQITQALGRGP